MDLQTDPLAVRKMFGLKDLKQSRDDMAPTYRHIKAKCMKVASFNHTCVLDFSLHPKVIQTTHSVQTRPPADFVTTLFTSFPNIWTKFQNIKYGKAIITFTDSSRIQIQVSVTYPKKKVVSSKMMFDNISTGIAAAPKEILKDFLKDVFIDSTFVTPPPPPPVFFLNLDR
eukprot:TRINITY_DN3141_c0_g1_i11.p1 TRINITY_DN3141_c0_g1~~TRINITY_DN3141_c0_g1_i11.p1  ORF type:complete len:170 (-),score=15.22 TRINITY_DN3141_c0_g1_i11:711-1220(-)